MSRTIECRVCIAAADILKIGPQEIGPGSELRGDLGATNFDILELGMDLEKDFAMHIGDTVIASWLGADVTIAEVAASIERLQQRDARAA